MEAAAFVIIRQAEKGGAWRERDEDWPSFLLSFVRRVVL